jgi:hypothetical protein
MGQQFQDGVNRKKCFLAQGFKYGLVFRKLGVRGKVFIEYAPSEAAWRPVEAPGYLVIHCLWVSGRYKRQNLGGKLLQYCLDDARERNGIVAVSGQRPFLTDTRFYLHHGFQLVERTNTGFDLVCYRTNSEASLPSFSESARRGTVSRTKGLHFEYAYQCPFVAVALRDLAKVAREFGLTVTSRELTTAESAHNAASPFGTFGVFLHGKFITHQLLSSRKFKSLLEKELCR